MFDNAFNTTLFALVTAVAVAAAVEIVHTEVELERTANAAAPAAGASQQQLTQAEPQRLPTVVVTGRHQPDGAPASAVAEVRSATTAS